MEQSSNSHCCIKVPSYAAPIVLGKLENEKILVWRLPKHIAQSRLAGRKKSSNACTLISLKLAEQIYRNGIAFPSPKIQKSSKSRCLSFFKVGIGKRSKSSKSFICSGTIISCMANAILEGNEIHEAVLSKKSSRRKNFTIPEAIKATGHLFCELDYCSVRGSIKTDLPRFLLGAIQSERLHSLNQLFFLLIAVHRCVIIVYNRFTNGIGLMDSHDHFPFGSMIACTELENIYQFSSWVEQEAFSELKYLEPALQNFELSSVCFTASTDSIKDRLIEVQGNSVGIEANLKQIFPSNREDQVVTREIRQRCEEFLARERRQRRTKRFGQRRTCILRVVN